MTLVDIKMFKHELATIFRHVQTTTMHPRDVRVIERIGDELVRYEEDRGTVFLAKDIVERLRKLSMAANRVASAEKYSRYSGPAMFPGQYTYGSIYWQSRRVTQNGKA
jgi:hypothetical protein